MAACSWATHVWWSQQDGGLAGCYTTVRNHAACPAFCTPADVVRPTGGAAWRGAPSPRQRCAEQLHQQQSGLQGRSAACIAYLHFWDFWGLFISPPCGQADLLSSRQRNGGTDLATGARGGEGVSWGPALLPSHPLPSGVLSPQLLQPHAPALHRLTAAAAAVPRVLHGNARAPRQLRRGLQPPPGPSPEPTPPRGAGLPTRASQLPQVLQASPANLPTQPHWSWCQGSSPLLPRKQPGSCGTRLQGCPYAHTLTGAAV